MSFVIEVGPMTLSYEIMKNSTVSLLQYPIRVFNHLNLTFIKPVEVTTEFYGSLNNRSNKTDLKPYENKTITFCGFQYFLSRSNF